LRYAFVIRLLGSPLGPEIRIPTSVSMLLEQRAEAKPRGVSNNRTISFDVFIEGKAKPNRGVRAFDRVGWDSVSTLRMLNLETYEFVRRLYGFP